MRPSRLRQSLPLVPIVLVGLVSLTVSASATSAPPVVPPSVISAPVISGSTQQGQTLTTSNGSWNGTQPLTYTYLWYRCNSGGMGCVALSAYGPTYVLVAGDVGSTLRVNVGARNSAGSASATSAATAVVTSSSSSSSGAPSVISAPVISGSTQQGQTLTTSNGSWNGTQPLTYTYLWYRCNSGGMGCVALPAYGPTYVLVAGDVGSTLRVNVGARNSAGSASATSAATAVVTGSQTTAPECSRSSLASCPASYFSGPLGSNNLIPNKPGAFLIDAYGGIGTSWAQFQTGVLQREADMGRAFDGIGIHYDGGGTWGGVFGMVDPAYFSPRREQWAHDHGSFPAVTWTPNYTISQMNNGAADAIWAKAANYFKTYNFPIMLRPFHEFDLPYVPWAAVPSSKNGNVNSCGGPFNAAWQRMVNIFKANGATNVGFWWTPFEGADRNCVNLSYPGDAYVDWVGSDIYNVCLVGRTDQWCTPLHSGWAQFRELFNYTALGSLLKDTHTTWGPRKPYVVGETATWYDANYPSYKGTWFRNIPTAAKNMKYLRGIMLFDQDVSANAADGPLGNYRVDNPTSNPDVYAGFKQMAADPWFNTR
jgi:Glycosyl hydrolase family 26